MIMQVLSQGPSLLLAVWTGLALLEGGEGGLRLPEPVSISGTSHIGSTTGLGITCSASGTVEWYQWYHNGTHTITILSTEHIIHYIRTPAKLTDSGDYYCRPCNRHGCGRNSSTWTVRMTAPSSASISGSTTVEYTQTFRLTCSVSGIANSYQWYHNYTRLSSTSSYYSKSAQQNDSGNYECKACNWAGCTSFSSNHAVTVTAVPPSSASITGSRHFKYTSRLELTCFATGIADTTTWYRNGTKLINSTSRSYYELSAQLSDSGSYQCTACNWAGCSTRSSSYPVSVIAPPSSVTISGSTTVGYTQTFRLTCSVSGIVNSYQWYHNYNRLSSTNRYYSKSAQQNDTGNYECRACNWAGCTTFSSNHAVTVTAVPPSSASITGSRQIKYTFRLELTCIATGIVDTTTWYRNGTKLINSTSRSYYKSSAQLSDSGSYQCTACNWAGCSTRSSSYAVTVIALGLPITMSISGDRSIGSTTGFRITCDASGMVESYRLYHNGTHISTITSTEHIIHFIKSSTELTDSGVYYCRACNRHGCGRNSSTWTVRLTAPSSASISGSTTVEYTQTFRLTCSVSGIANSYLWYHNYTRLSSTSSYYSKSAQQNDTGNYECKACNWAGCSSFSSNHAVTVTAVPPSSASITGSRQIKYTFRLELTCTATGIADTTTWYRNGTKLINSTSRSYYKSSAQLSDSGSYQCVACNWAGCSARSSSYPVTVIVPPYSVTISGSTTVGYTQTFRLTCSVSGIANSYLWYHNYTRLPSTSSYYSKSAQQNDTGNYECRACNWAGCTTFSSNHAVTVTAVPPSSARISGSRQIKYTSRLELTCIATGIVDTTTWYRNGMKLINSTSRSYHRSSAQFSDSGSYQCVACNWAGCSTRSSSYPVMVIDVPDTVDVSTIEVTNTTFDTISIQWTPPNNNFDSIIYYRVVIYGSGGLVGVFTPSQPMVTLVSLQPFTTYQIRISARNNAGWGGNSSERNVNTLTRDEVLASNITYSTPRGGVSSYTVELRWVVPEGLLTDKLEGYRLSRWPTNTTNIETTTVNRDNVSCAWNVTAIDSETYCHKWEGFSPGCQYTVSVEIVYNYGILSTGGPTNVTITIPTLPLFQENADSETVFLAVGVALGVFLVVLVTAVVLIVVLLICKKYRRMKTSGKTEAYYYNQRTNVYIQQEVVSIDSEELSSDPHYKPLDLSSVQQSSYSKLNVGSKSSDSTGITQGAKEYEYPSSKPTPQKKPKPKKKPSKKIPIQPDIVEGSTTTGNNPKYVNMEIMAEPPGGIEQSLTTATSTHGYINVEHIAEQPGQTAPSSTSNIISNAYVNIELVEAEQPVLKSAVSPPVSETSHHQVPSSSPGMKVASTPQQLSTTPKRPLLPPTQQSATPKPQTKPSKQKPNPIKTLSSSDSSSKPPTAPKSKKHKEQVQGSPLPESRTNANQPPAGNKVSNPLSPGSSVAELRKKLEKSFH